MGEQLDEYGQESDLDHVKNRTSMYLGGLDPVSKDEYVMEGDSIIRTKIFTSPAAVKCYDEILVNSIDRWTKTGGNVNISITYKDGVFSILNTGSSIQVIRQKTLDGREMWAPQFLFTEFRTSGNFNKKDQSRRTGGTFGMGAKLVPAYSKSLIIETFDVPNKKYYRQEISNGMKCISPPEVDELKEDEIKAGSKTEITVHLNFDEFQIKEFSAFERLLYMRAVQTSVYIYPRRVSWNDKLIDIQLPSQLVTAHLLPYYSSPKLIQIVEMQLEDKEKYSWKIAIGFQPAQGFGHVTLVNGIYAKNGGTHVDHITDQIVDGVRERYLAVMKKNTRDKNLKFNRNMVLKYLFLFMTCVINQPSFTGQRKDEIDTPQSRYSDIKLLPEQITLIWNKLEAYMEIDLIDKAQSSEKKTRKKKIKAKKYTAASNAGTRYASQTGLFIAEGDSAVGTIDKLINSKNSVISNENYGYFSIQGVPVNARKEITVKHDIRTGQDVKIRSKKLLDNERINALIEVTGLVRGREYKNQSDLDSLRYGHVIIATDQDEDGKGNIRSQVMNLFQTEWPNLFNHRWVKFLVTPIVRAYHRKGTMKIQEFRSVKDYNQWKSGVNTDEWEIIYYKGLGSHSNNEIDHMATQLKDMIITATSEDAKESEREFEIYFGKDPDLRKTVLKHPPTETEESFYYEGTLDVVDHLRTETKYFQLYNISRHIPHVMDGMLPTTRKIFCGARKKFRKNERCKVYQLTGYVTENMNYHHGDASANGVAVGMAQDYPGSNEFPMLRALSNFGSLKQGGSDAGHPRYIYTKSNKKLSHAMFPLLDDFILEYTFDDGVRGEPVYYIPIIPLAILESYKSPGHGWATTMWARDWKAVYAYVRECVRAGELQPRKEDFPPSACGTDHLLILDNKGIHQSVGRYTVKDDNTIIITSLPIRKWNEHLINGNPDISVKEKAKRQEAKSAKSRPWNDDPDIDDVRDKSNAVGTYIVVTFKAGVLKKIREGKTANGIDPVIQYLGLKQSLKSNINMINTSGAVSEFKEYTDILQHWFPARKRLYQTRVERRIILVELKILQIQQKLLFAKHRHEYKLNDMNLAAQENVMAEQKYVRINHVLLASPEYTETKNLKRDILDGRWDYLLKMTSLSVNREGIAKLNESLKSLEAELADLKKPDTYPGCREWLAELDELEAVITRGKKEGWDAWDVKPKWT